jgi:aminoglycoside phosphotransferase (APT) family kinase protein
MTYEGNRTVHRLSRPLDAWQAGGLVARFHAAVHGVAWEFRSVRPAVHDTQAHMNRLEQAIARHRTHRLFDDVAPLAEEIRKQWETWHGTDDLPRRIIHGDLKVSNVRFVDDSAHCLIDLDTMGWGTFDMEMGDAMRSWCNPTSEDSMESRFDIAMFESAMSGYADACRKLHTDQTPTRAEWESVVAGVERVTLELASRFARDALEEAYFGFNPRYGGRGEHNLLRARGQFHLAQRVREQAAEAERILHNLQTRLT